MFFNTKTIAAAVTAGALLLPIAAQAEEGSFEHNGSTYAYKTSTVNGRTVIRGKTDRSTPFRLVVRGKRVTGVYNGKPVEFALRGEYKPAGEGEAVAALR